MAIYPQDARWKQLQSRINEQLSGDGWQLRQLDVVRTNGRDVTHAVLERIREDETSDQVLGTGATADEAVLAAIRTARVYPAPV